MRQFTTSDFGDTRGVGQLGGGGQGGTGHTGGTDGKTEPATPTADSDNAVDNRIDSSRESRKAPSENHEQLPKDPRGRTDRFDGAL
jgi:hypothetical protein